MVIIMVKRDPYTPHIVGVQAIAYERIERTGPIHITVLTDYISRFVSLQRKTIIDIIRKKSDFLQVKDNVVTILSRPPTINKYFLQVNNYLQDHPYRFYNYSDMDELNIDIHSKKFILPSLFFRGDAYMVCLMLNNGALQTSARPQFTTSLVNVQELQNKLNYLQVVYKFPNTKITGTLIEQDPKIAEEIKSMTIQWKE